MTLASENYRYILKELQRIDRLIQNGVYQIRDIFKRDDAYRGLYISDTDIDKIYASPIGTPQWLHSATDSSPQPLYSGATRTESSKIDEFCPETSNIRLISLQQHFNLTDIEIDIILICLTPEIDLRYERLFGYLHDDITRRWPDIDIIAGLLGHTIEKKFQIRRMISSDTTLVSEGIVELFTDPTHCRPSQLATLCKLSRRIVGFLLECDSIDLQLLDSCTLHPVENIVFNTDEFYNNLSFKRAVNCIEAHNLDSVGCCFSLLKADEMVIDNFVSGLRIILSHPSLSVNLNLLIHTDFATFQARMRSIKREYRLQNCILFFSQFDLLLDTEKKEFLSFFWSVLREIDNITILSTSRSWEPDSMMYDKAFITIQENELQFLEQKRVWKKLLNEEDHALDDADISVLAEMFRFPPAKVKSCILQVKNHILWEHEENHVITRDDVIRACRDISRSYSGYCAKRVIPHFSWGDIVLPADRIDQLKEICSYVRYRSVVYEKWGFGNKLTLGKGLNVLFSGSSGTGKTMASEIIANDLCLDLLKIDLSMIVNKYIGETEKNLSKVFDDARSAHAILLFDEADALFGKRSEIRDSHDRYANIEVGFLLQKIEEYDGIVILTTNLKKNLDDAFVRRMHFIVDFPFPSVDDRKKVWRTIWPDSVPFSESVDFDAIALKYELTGGNIKNAAVAAAFLAVSNGGALTLQHIRAGIRREYQKMGKVILENGAG